MLAGLIAGVVVGLLVAALINESIDVTSSYDLDTQTAVVVIGVPLCTLLGGVIAWWMSRARRSD